MKRRRSRIEEILNESKYRLRVNLGNLKLFVDRREHGYVLGSRVPLNGVKNDHLTIGVKGEEFDEIHRKVGGIEQWRHTEDSIRFGIDEFIRTNQEEIEPSELAQEGVHMVSWARVAGPLSILNSLVQMLIALIGRSVFNYNIIEVSERKVAIKFGVDKRRAEYYARKLSYPIAKLFGIFAHIPQKCVTSVLLRFGRMFLIKMNENGELESDFAFLISQNRIGFIWPNDNEKISYISIQALDKARHELEQNLPFGKMSAMLNFVDSYGEIIVER
jgi:hypothetical protein